MRRHPALPFSLTHSKNTNPVAGSRVLLRTRISYPCHLTVRFYLDGRGIAHAIISSPLTQLSPNSRPVPTIPSFRSRASCSPMAATHHRRPISMFPLFLLIILIGRGVESQPPANGASTNSTGDGSNNGQYFTGHFNPYTVIIIVVLISAFFLLGFFSIYIRQCGNHHSPFAASSVTSAAAIARLRLQRGLNREMLESFPTLEYSEVKEHKIGKGALECAICLNEFEDDETIRLLPKCDHVFHQECIDAWLDTHVTCPVCRTNYADFSSAEFTARVPVANHEAGVTTVLPEAPAIPDTPGANHVVDLVDDMEERKEEMRELARIATRVRGNGPRRSKRLPRSHSTGHSMTPKGEAENDRYTLRLPENVRKEIMAAGRLKRAKTFGVIGAGSGSLRRISRGGGEGSSLRGPTIRLGRSDRWPSFFGGSVSAKIPAWGNWKRGEEVTLGRKSSGVKPTVDIFGGGGAAAGRAKAETYDGSVESSTAALNRV